VRFIGLTGGIASGKSTVSAMLRELGAQIIDADVVAREVVEPGQPALAEIAARFPGVLGADGRLDRQKLGERIFGDEAERAALNAIIHPRIQHRFMEQTAALEKAGHELVVYDAPLLIENRIHEWMNGVILVTAPREVQLARLIARNGLTRAQAEGRLASQLPLEEKQQYATWIVDNKGDLADTRAQVERVWKQVRSSR
jgi:dephospho-CoA kinase